MTKKAKEFPATWNQLGIRIHFKLSRQPLSQNFLKAIALFVKVCFNYVLFKDICVFAQTCNFAVLENSGTGKGRL